MWSFQPASLMAYHAQKPAVASASVELSGSGYEQYAQVNALQGFGRNHVVESTAEIDPGVSKEKAGREVSALE